MVIFALTTWSLTLTHRHFLFPDSTVVNFLIILEAQGMFLAVEVRARVIPAFFPAVDVTRGRVVFLFA